MIIVMQQCFGGSFLQALTIDANNNPYPNRSFYSATKYVPNQVPTSEPSRAELWITNGLFSEFSFYWLAAVRGYYPSTSMPWSNLDTIGEFPFIQYFQNASVPHPLDYNPDVLAHSGNNDGIIQLNESFRYMNDFNTFSTYGYRCVCPSVEPNSIETPTQYSSFTYNAQDLLTLGGISGGISTSLTLTETQLIGYQGLDIASGASLNIDSNSIIYLSGKSRITVRAGASINIGNNVTFIGVNPTVGDTQGNRIEVYGNITMGSNVHFVSESGHTWDGLYINNSQALTFVNVSISNCRLEKTGGSLSLQNATCDNGSISGLSTTINISGIITLNSGSRLVTDAASTLSVANNTQISGNVATLPPSSAHPNGIYGSRIEVNGNITVGSNVSLTAIQGNTWDGLYIDNNQALAVSNVNVINCKLVKNNGSLNLLNVICINGNINGVSSIVNLVGTLTLNGGSILSIDANSTLNIAENVSVYGASDSKNSRINVYGDLNWNGNNIHFTAEPNQYWHGLYYYGVEEIILDQCTFTNCNLYKENGSVEIINSSFNYAYISCVNASLKITDCPIISGIYCEDSEIVDIQNNTGAVCTTSGLEHGIMLNRCAEISIIGYTISNNNLNGISMYECFISHNTIKDCRINSNQGEGIRLYHSNATIISCHIIGNNKGIAAYRACNVEVYKDPETEAWDHDSFIANNSWQEIVFLDDCDFFM